MQTCYNADHYFECLDAQFLDQKFEFALYTLSYWRRHRLARLRRGFFNYLRFAAVAYQLLRLDDNGLRARYRRQLSRIVRARWHEPQILFVYALKVSFHYHFDALVRALDQVDEASEMPTAGRSFSRVKRRAERQAAA
jgi:hypothetical protein